MAGKALIRLAVPDDAKQLFALNEDFNGAGSTTTESIRASLAENRQEFVVVAETVGALAGFVCAQIKRSFCYRVPTAEITEVFVKQGFRRQGLGRTMLTYAEQICRERYAVAEITLLTGMNNRAAQALYGACGFRRSGEAHYEKEV